MANTQSTTLSCSVWPWLCQRIHLIKIYIFFYTTFQLVYMYWLYKVIYEYKVQKQEHLQWRHGPEVLYVTTCVSLYLCACVWDSIHVQYGHMDSLSYTQTHSYADTHTEYGLGWTGVISNSTTFQHIDEYGVQQHSSVCNTFESVQ